MAEYAGLEIRIGGNTTKLTNALKAPTKSAAELQSRIRQITRAMQFDPTNLKNVDTRIKITGDRMQSLQAKSQIAKTAMEQLGSSMRTLNGKERSVSDIAKETQNLSLKAKQADERFNGLTGTLAKIYESWNKLSRDKGADFIMDEMGGFSQEEADRLMRGTTSMREFVAALKEAQRIRTDPLYDGGGSFITDDMIEKAKQFKELNFHAMFERGLGLDDMIGEAKNLGVVLEDSAIANVRELQKTFKEAQEDKKAFDDALKFDQLATDAQRLDSEVESLSQTMRHLDDGMTVATRGGAFQGLESEIRKVDAALDNVEQDLRSTGEALKVDPGNVQLAARYYSDLQQKVELSEEKAELLNRQMRLLGVNGASEAAKNHQDLAKWIEESAESARVANKELSEQQATVANLEGQVKTLKQTIANIKGDSTIAEYSDNVIQWKKQTDNLSAAMEKLKQREQDVANEQAKLGEAQGNFDKAEEEVDEYKNKLEQLRAEQKQLMDLFEQGDPSTDYESALQRINELEAEIQQVDTAYKGAQTNVKEFNSALESQRERASNAEDMLRQQRNAVDDLKQTVDDLADTREVKLFQNPGDEIEKAEAELVGLESELDKAKAKENELEDAYDSAKTENELAKTAQAARETSQEFDEAKANAKKAMDELGAKPRGLMNASTVKSLGMTLSATLTPALVGVGYKMVDASSTVDAAYRDMRKTVNGTEEQFEHLRSAAIDFSRTHVTSADQILSIEAIGGELGVATKDLQTFAEVISNIDVATNLDTEGAAETLGHLSNILHLTEDDYVGFSDALVRLGNNGASTETEIANIAERIGSMGSIVGMSGSDILAWSSSIASTGQNAEAAGTAISRTMSFMETAVASAGGTMDTSFEAIDAAVQEGGDKLTVFASLAGMTADEFSEAWATNSEEMASSIGEQMDEAKNSLQTIADIAHMSADEFAKTWEEDPTAAMKAFIEGLNDVEAAGGSADKVLMDLGIRAVRQKQAIEGLMQTVGGLDDNLKMSEDAWNGVSDKWGQAGDAANEAQKKAEGFSGQIQILKNVWQNFLSELGEGAAPIIKFFSGAVEGISKWFSGIDSSGKTAIVAIGGVTAALGPLLSFGATMATSTGDLKKWFSEATSGMNLVKMVYSSTGKVITEEMAGAMTTMQKVKVVGANFGMTLLKGIAAVAVIAAIGMIIAELKKLYDQYQDHIAATVGLSSALQDVGKAGEVSTAGIESTSKPLAALAADAKDSESRLAGLTRTIEDSNKQYSTFAGQMDYYATTIETLGDKSNRTEDESYKLQAALQAVNDACGTTYGLDEYGNIIDTETGKIQENTDVINANIAARKNQALIDYYSDDYAQAVGEHADAQDKLNEATDKYNDLISKSGKSEFFANAKKTYGNQYEQMRKEGKIQAAYEEEVRRAKETMGSYQNEVNKTGDAMMHLEEKIASAEKEVNKSNKAIEKAAKAQEQLDKRTETVTADVTGNMKRMSDAATELGTSDKKFNNIVDTLGAINVSAAEMGNVDMSSLVSAFTDAGSSMADVIATLEAGGVTMSTWNAALEQAPGAAENMGTVTSAAFQTMYDSANNDLNATMTLIAGLDMVQVGDKTFYIGDNGSITDSQGKVYSLETDLASIPNEVITAYYLDDADAAQKLIENKAKLDNVSKQNPKPKIGVVDNASKTTDSLQKKLSTVGGMKPTPGIYASDHATGTINGISRGLTNLNGRVSTVYVRTVEQKVKQATGGMNNRPVIPRHATGYIATGPTLTNQGWIGEDGVEAVANWATGGAVVPLTNKKFMLPIADAIADGMVARNGGAGTVNNYYVNNAVVNDDPAIQAAFLNLFAILEQKGAMNRG